MFITWPAERTFGLVIYSHITGEKILKELSNILRGNTRQSELVGRHGGEEFPIMLVEASLNVGFEVSEKINKLAIYTNYSQKFV